MLTVKGIICFFGYNNLKQSPDQIKLEKMIFENENIETNVKSDKKFNQIRKKEIKLKIIYIIKLII